MFLWFWDMKGKEENGVISLYHLVCPQVIQAPRPHGFSVLYEDDRRIPFIHFDSLHLIYLST